MKLVDHAFCINLERRTDRMEQFRAALPSNLVGSVERFAAVDGRALTMTPEIAALFTQNDFHFRRNIIGCSLSHYALWKRIAANDYPYECSAIFEDDVWFSDQFAELWDNEMAPTLPPSFDLVYLGGLLGPATTNGMTDLVRAHGGHITVPTDVYATAREGPHFVRPKPMQFCTFSYLISRKGARMLCDLVERDRFQRSIDWFMIDRWKEMSVLASDPLLCWSVFQEGSDILLDFDTLTTDPEEE